MAKDAKNQTQTVEGIGTVKPYQYKSVKGFIDGVAGDKGQYPVFVSANKIKKASAKAKAEGKEVLCICVDGKWLIADKRNFPPGDVSKYLSYEEWNTSKPATRNGPQALYKKYRKLSEADKQIFENLKMSQGLQERLDSYTKYRADLIKNKQPAAAIATYDAEIKKLEEEIKAATTAK